MLLFFVVCCLYLLANKLFQAISSFIYLQLAIFFILHKTHLFSFYFIIVIFSFIWVLAVPELSASATLHLQHCALTSPYCLVKMQTFVSPVVQLLCSQIFSYFSINTHKRTNFFLELESSIIHPVQPKQRGQTTVLYHNYERQLNIYDRNHQYFMGVGNYPPLVPHCQAGLVNALVYLGSGKS